MGSKIKYILPIVFIAAAGLLAQTEVTDDVIRIPIETQRVSSGKTPLEDQLREFWQKALSSANQDALPDAEVNIKQMQIEAKRYGVGTLTDYCWASLVKHFQEREAGNQLNAQFFLKASDDFGPRLPEPKFVAGNGAFQDGSYGIGMKEYANGVLTLFRRTEYMAPLLGNILFYLLTTFYILAVFFILVLFCKYLSRIWHDLQELLQMKIHSVLNPLIGVLILFLPFILGFDIRWHLVYLMVFIFGYATKQEKVFLLVILFAGILIPPTLHLLRQEYRVRVSPVFEATAAIERGDLVYNYIGNIETINNIVGNDADLLFLIANLYQKSGDMANAMSYYQKTLNIDPEYFKAFLNLGNLYFWENHFETAIDKYKNAVNINNSYIPAYYNMYIAYNNNYQYDEGQNVYRGATAINGRAMARIAERTAQNEVTVDFFSTDDARRKYGEFSQTEILEGKEIRGHVKRDTLMENIIYPLVILSFFGIIGCLFLDRWRISHGGYAGACVKCGRTFCHLCKRSSESNIYCSQCVHIYIKKDGVPLEVKVKKINEVKRYLRFTFFMRKIVNLLFPGTVSIVNDSTWKGLITLFIIGLCGMVYFFPPLFPSLNMDVFNLDYIRKGVLAVAVIVWLISNVKNLLERGGV